MKATKLRGTVKRSGGAEVARVTVYLPLDVAAALKRHCFENGIEQSAFAADSVIRAVRRAVDDSGQHNTAQRYALYGEHLTAKQLAEIAGCREELMCSVLSGGSSPEEAVGRLGIHEQDRCHVGDAISRAFATKFPGQACRSGDEKKRTMVYLAKDVYVAMKLHLADADPPRPMSSFIEDAVREKLLCI